MMLFTGSLTMVQPPATLIPTSLRDWRSLNAADTVAYPTGEGAPAGSSFGTSATLTLERAPASSRRNRNKWLIGMWQGLTMRLSEVGLAGVKRRHFTLIIDSLLGSPKTGPIVRRYHEHQ